MSTKIATRAYCNTIQANTFTTDLTRCPKSQEIEETGLQIGNRYSTNQLVRQEDITKVTEFKFMFNIDEEMMTGIENGEVRMEPASCGYLTYSLYSAMTDGEDVWFGDSGGMFVDLHLLGGAASQLQKQKVKYHLRLNQPRNLVPDEDIENLNLDMHIQMSPDSLEYIGFHGSYNGMNRITIDYYYKIEGQSEQTGSYTTSNFVLDIDSDGTTATVNFNDNIVRFNNPDNHAMISYSGFDAAYLRVVNSYISSGY